MKKKIISLFLLLMILLSQIGPAVIATEDTSITLEQYLIKNGVDTDGDKKISDAEWAKVKNLYLSYDEDIKNVKEVEKAINLKSLNIYGTDGFNTIDFSKLQNLESLVISYSDEVKNLDFSKVSNTKNLKSLYINYNGDKSTLDFSKLTNLQEENIPIPDDITIYKNGEIFELRTDGKIEYENNIIEISELTRDLSSTLRDYYQSVNSDTARLNEVQERLYLFDKLKRKYGSTLEEVIQTYDKLSEELNTIEFSSKNVEEIQAKIDEILVKLNKLAQDISAKRKNYAQVLSSLIVDELEKLELAKSRFEIRITPKELSSDGIDDVEFYISTNVSQDLSPLAKTASGGEISRVMLAIKTIFAKSDEIDTVIFDEIDTGISGKAAQSVADEISELAKFRQIIVITHQAIIAVKADKHFLVSKEQGEKTEVTIKALNEDEKVKAIASLASGDNSESALDFAKSLLSAK